jgi:hypothetical protein
MLRFASLAVLAATFALTGSAFAQFGDCPSGKCPDRPAGYKPMPKADGPTVIVVEVNHRVIDFARHMLRDRPVRSAVFEGVRTHPPVRTVCSSLRHHHVRHRPIRCHCPGCHCGR